MRSASDRKTLFELWRRSWPEVVKYLKANAADVAIKVKNEPVSPPKTLGEWYAKHSGCRRTWDEGQIGNYHVHRCSCGEKAHVKADDYGKGMGALLSVK